MTRSNTLSHCSTQRYLLHAMLLLLLFNCPRRVKQCIIYAQNCRCRCSGWSSKCSLLYCFEAGVYYLTAQISDQAPAKSTVKSFIAASGVRWRQTVHQSVGHCCVSCQLLSLRGSHGRHARRSHCLHRASSDRQRRLQVHAADCFTS